MFVKNILIEYIRNILLFIVQFQT